MTEGIGNMTRNLSSTSCWTCKDRKVRCDRSIPECQNCARVRRECLGYGMRLSWPRKIDRKRAILGADPGRTSRSKSYSYFIPTTFQDIAMHDYLMQIKIKEMPGQPRNLPVRLITPAYPSCEKICRQSVDGETLIQYFVSNAIFSLSTFNMDVTGFQNLLIQMALSNSSAPSRAVLYAMLAFSQQHFDGHQGRAIQFKISAIQALATSARETTLDTRELAQHVAAGMLLCSLETQISSETSGHWLVYLRGVKDVIRTSRLHEKMIDSYVAHLVDWVYYHDVIAQFSRLHWRQDCAAVSISTPLESSWPGRVEESDVLKIVNYNHPSHRVLQFLSEVFMVTSQALEESDAAHNVVHNINALEGSASTAREIFGRYGSASTEVTANATNMLKLYELAAAIYLSRVSEYVSGRVRDVQSLLDDAFELLRCIRTCELQFPLLILGCESKTDEQRAMMLELVQRTEQKSYYRSLDCLRRSLRALWVQEDLATEGDCASNYMDRLTAIISKTRFIPSLV